MSRYIVYMASILDDKGVFLLCSVLAVIIFFVYQKFWKSRQLLNCLPGLFTSLGLLGTFCALYNSLNGIQEDNLNVTVIIQHLIPAFTSSIAGLISAFIATLITRILYAREDSIIDKKISKITPEECLYNILSLSKIISVQIYDETEKNKEYQKELNSTIGEQSKILEKFINDFVERMDSIFTRMHGQIEQNIKDFGEEQFKNCADTLQTLTCQLMELSTSILQMQESSVKQMVSDTNASLSAVSESVATQITTMCEQMSTTLSGITNTQNEKLESMLASYDNLSTRLAAQNNEFAEKMNEKVNTQYEKLQEHNVQSLQQMSDLSDAYTEVNRTILQRTSEMNREVTNALREKLSGFVQDLHDSISSNIEQLQRSYDYISDHVANIKGYYESAANAYSDAVNNAHRLNESQENLLESIDNSMQNVVTTNKKVNEMIELLKNRQEHIDTLIAHINEIDTAIVSLQNLENQLNRIAAK